MTMTRSDHRNETQADTSGALSVTFTAFTPQNNSILVASIASNITPNDPTTAHAVSGGSLTWTRLGIARTTSGGYFQNAEIWIAPVGTAASTSIVVANAATVTDALVYCQASSWTNPNATQNGGTITSNALGASGTGTLTLSAAPATDDITLYNRFFFENGATDPTATAGSGWTKYAEKTGTGGYGGFASQVRPEGSTSATVAWTNVNVEGVTLLADIGVSVVIKGVAAGGTKGQLVGSRLLRGGILHGGVLVG